MTESMTESMTDGATIDEIADGLFRISIFVPQVGPKGFSFSHFLWRDEEPLLYHAGMRRMFPLLAPAVAHLMPLERLRWISFGHVEADECGGMNDWLAAAPHATIAHGATGCRVSLNDLADRTPRALADGEIIATGARRFRWLATPHVPHGWDAGAMFEETSGTLLCGDLLSQFGRVSALTEHDIVAPATETTDFVYSTSLGPTTAPTLRRLAALEPRLLAVMHGASFAGDGGGALRELAARYDAHLQRMLEEHAAV